MTFHCVTRKEKMVLSFYKNHMHPWYIVVKEAVGNMDAVRVVLESLGGRMDL